ncbi:hypothetical protein OUZ56_016004 [Daphnia magna]|uniref:Uncharacterized protein n=1 Tax=Daphnia magna TaxID=35525 RepID=A0ABR0APU2_9CRUS|nr:hypothetical protein OUZ56_016004 [Daphnia magna]
MGHVGIGIIHAYAINLYFVYNINISLKSVFEIHGANLPHYHCQLTPLVGHPGLYLEVSRAQLHIKSDATLQDGFMPVVEGSSLTSCCVGRTLFSRHTAAKMEPQTRKMASDAFAQEIIEDERSAFAGL